MPRYVALFRGINVGKAKRIAMADLRKLLTKLGYTDVQTLLNSGNAVFTADTVPAGTHAERIRAAMLKQTGVDALVIIKSDKEFAGIIADNKLGSIADNPARLLVALTDRAKLPESTQKLARDDWGAEKIHVGKQAVYLWCANGILESRALVALLKSLNSTGTTRNWATLKKIHALLSPRA
jgi:uncharacterized protein (DUF1697 family)